MATLNVPIRIKRGDGIPTQLRQGELAFDQQNVKLYIGSGAEVNGFAPNVVELTTPPTVLEDLSNISVGSGAADGDVLVYDGDTGNWVAQALAAASVAWGDITGKPATFAPEAHTHGSISDDGKIGNTAGLVVQTGASGALSTLTAGTAGQVLKQGSSGLEWGTADGTPTDNTVSTAKLQDSAVTADKIADAAVTMAKIAQAGATANQVIKWNGSAWAPADDATATGSSGAPSEAEYLVKSSDGGLSAERVVTDSTSVAADWSTSGQVQLQRAALTGDVTAAANSNETTIANGAVTYAKIQDVSAADKILGRATAGAGDVEEITCTAAGRALLDDADAAAQRTTLGLGTAATSASTDFFAASAVSAFGENLISEENAAAARTTLGLGGASEKAVDFYAEASHSHGNITTAGAIGSTSGLPVKTGASGVLEAGAFGTSAGEFAEGNHTHAWTDITSKPSDFTPSAHNHTVTLEISGFIESPEAKTYVLSPAIPAAITITNVKAKTSEGTVDIKLQDDGVDITNTTIGDVGTSVAEPATEPSATVAADSVLALVVSDLQTSPKNLAFTVHYTVASANNA